ncbi:DUF555 domain-containing protein [Halorarum halobium]|uniref:DUF555 domain-containing protein n=1 Tax=Halorarum halobium TaxID=3075121 RepID=UPI003CCCBE67
MDCRVVVEAAVPVYDVETTDEAVRIAIAKTGEMLNPDLNYVEISTGQRRSPGGEELPPAFVAADEALVALELALTVFNVEGTRHASRIARKEIGQRLENIPLKVLDVSEVVETDEDDSGNESRGDDSGDVNRGDGSEDVAQGDGSGSNSNGGASAGRGESDSDTDDDDSADDPDDDLLPGFEEMVEDG